MREKAWFEQLFSEHAPAIVKYLARRGAYDEAEDLAAEVFMVAWRKREEIPEGSELPWLYRTAAWTLNNYYRKKKAIPLGENQELLDSSDSHDPASLVIKDQVMRQALQALPERDREILLLAAWEGLEGDALAAHLGITRGGADAALSRARSRFEKKLEELS